jgi:ribonuclease R
MLGAVTEVLGNKNTVGTDVLSIVRQFDLTETFSKAAQRQARQISESVADDDRVTRESLVDKMVFTIDGADAKGFRRRGEPGASLKRQPLPRRAYRGRSALREGRQSADRDALERGTSVYLPTA